MKIPGFLIAAPSSGSGKTAVSCALMSAFQNRKMDVRAFKCGPDYIDPMFHREVLGIPSGNLDLFFSDQESLKKIYLKQSQGADLTVTEGVMGFYDGRTLDSESASSYDVARVLGLPVIMVLPCKGSALSLCAVIKGFVRFREDSNIQGILLNRISPALYPRMKKMLEEELEKENMYIPVVGYVPEDDLFTMESRHLGLVLPYETDEIRNKLKRAGELLSKTVDMEMLLAIAGGTETLFSSENVIDQETSATSDDGIRIGIARDKAFCFYYRENLELLEKYGCHLIPFSPLSDARLPEGVDGLILGGGYPELYGEILSSNTEMLHSIKKALLEGMPCIAECGGFMYLHEEMEDNEGKCYQMAGVIPGRTRPVGKLGRFGYIEISGRKKLYQDGFLRADEVIKGHEFHYWDSTDCGDDCLAQKPDGKRSWNCVHMKENLFAGYPHLYLPSLPVFAERFANKCRTWRSTPEERLKTELAMITPVDLKSGDEAKKRWKTVAKPLFSLGKLEDAVIRMAQIRGCSNVTLQKKGLIIMCADNGVVEEGVTQTGQDVTAVVARNFTKGEASVCMMAKSAGVDLFPVDIGMASDVLEVTKKQYKICRGTRNMAKGPAMSREQAARAVLTGIQIVKELAEKGYDILATGEMGIGNTTTSSAVVSVLLGKDAEYVTGRGAGLSSEGLNRKIEVIRRAVCINKPDPEDVLDVLCKVGGLDIAGLAGVFLGGAICRIPIVIDGFISSAAALCAARMVPDAVEYMLPSHRSGEPAGGMILDSLGLSPFIDCGMSLGEGSGAVAVLPLLEMGLSVYREMSTFEEINVEQYQELI